MLAARSLLLFVLVCLLPGWGRAGGQRAPELAVRFLVGAESNDGTTFATTITWQERPVVVSRVAVVTEREIVSFFPYRAADGSFAASFQLNDNGRLALHTVSASKRGGRLYALIGGRVVTPLAIDRIISDGIISIPLGLTEADIRALGKNFRIMPEAHR